MEKCANDIIFPFFLVNGVNLLSHMRVFRHTSNIVKVGVAVPVKKPDESSIGIARHVVFHPCRGITAVIYGEDTNAISRNWSN
jgi:hypothetical protein